MTRLKLLRCSVSRTSTFPELHSAFISPSFGHFVSVVAVLGDGFVVRIRFSSSRAILNRQMTQLHRVFVTASVGLPRLEFRLSAVVS